MKKSLFFIASLFLVFMHFSFNLFAQSTDSISLEILCESLAANPNTTGDFTQTKTILTNGRSLKSSGKFIISTYGIMWKTEKPFPSSLILTENKMIQIAANGNKSVMNGDDNQIFANISNTLTSLFSGNITELQNNFNCTLSQNKENWSLLLSPKDSTIASVMQTLVLSGTYEKNKNDSAKLNSLLLTEVSGNTTLYEFSNQKYPKELSSDEKQIFISE